MRSADIITFTVNLIVKRFKWKVKFNSLYQNLYVEYSVDDSQVKRTCSKKEYLSVWNEETDLHVNTNSTIKFLLMDKAKIPTKRLGTAQVELYKTLCCFNGRLSNQEVTAPVYSNNSHTHLGDLKLVLSSSTTINIPEQDRVQSGATVTHGSRTPVSAPENYPGHSRSAAGISMDPLPVHIERRFDSCNRPYYVDHLTKKTSWKQHQPLPPGWERSLDPQGREYYLDHNTRTTTWQRPDAGMLSNITHFQRWRDEQNNFMQQTLNQRYNVQSWAGNVGANAAIGGPSLLPVGWEKRYDPNNRPYFINHITRTTQWEDPSVMPTCWEIRDFNEDAYFVDNNTKTTTSIDPRTYKNVKDGAFLFKQHQFYNNCLNLCTTEGHTKIVVRRYMLMEDSFREIMRHKPKELYKRLFIQFKDEDGLDYGGVSREWFFQLSHELLNPMYCLFEYASDNNYSLQINPASYVNPEHLQYFRFVGRFVAMAMFHRKFIDSGFTIPFYKKMLGKSITLEDIESVDIEYFNSLVFLRDNDIDCLDMGLDFSANYECLGKIELRELKPGGQNINVCEKNKMEYIDLMVNWRFSRGVEKQTKSFLDGFNEVVPVQLINVFDGKEIEWLLCGMQKLDENDWEENTVYRVYTTNSAQIKWFWRFVKTLQNEEKIRLLQFVTGTCRLPVGGFRELMGSNGPQKFCIEQIGKDSWLPRSHTCFNRLDLPPYTSFKQLKEKLTYAIMETEGFGQE